MPYIIRPKADVDTDADDFANAVFATGSDPVTKTGLTNDTAYYAQEFVLSPTTEFTPTAAPAGPSVGNYLAFENRAYNMGANMAAADAIDTVAVLIGYVRSTAGTTAILSAQGGTNGTIGGMSQSSATGRLTFSTKDAGSTAEDSFTRTGASAVNRDVYFAAIGKTTGTSGSITPSLTWKVAGAAWNAPVSSGAKTWTGIDLTTSFRIGSNAYGNTEMLIGGIARIGYWTFANGGAPDITSATVRDALVQSSGVAVSDASTLRTLLETTHSGTRLFDVFGAKSDWDSYLTGLYPSTVESGTGTITDGGTDPLAT